MFWHSFLLRSLDAPRMVYKVLVNRSTAFKLLFGILLLGFVCEAALMQTLSEDTLSSTAQSASNHTVAVHTAAVAATSAASVPPTPSTPANTAVLPAVPIPKKVIATPAAPVAPIAGSLTLSTTSLTVGPGRPGSITITPSPGSMFYTIFVQSVLNISCDVSVKNNVTAPFTVTYGYPDSMIGTPVPGSYDLTILAQDQTKAIQYYHFQITVVGPTSN